MTTPSNIGQYAVCPFAGLGLNAKRRISVTPSNQTHSFSQPFHSIRTCDLTLSLLTPQGQLVQLAVESESFHGLLNMTGRQRIESSSVEFLLRKGSCHAGMLRRRWAQHNKLNGNVNRINESSVGRPLSQWTKRFTAWNESFLYCDLLCSQHLLHVSVTEGLDEGNH